MKNLYLILLLYKNVSSHSGKRYFPRGTVLSKKAGRRVKLALVIQEISVSISED